MTNTITTNTRRVSEYPLPEIQRVPLEEVVLQVFVEYCLVPCMLLRWCCRY